MSPPDPLVLGFDTSAAHCAAAICSGDRILATVFEEMSKGQAERLFPLIDGLLATAQVSWSDLTAIGVGTGPGNFTGIRIAVASARGLSLSLGVPSVGVSAFEAMAFVATQRPLLTVVDGRRDSLHVQLLDANGAADDPETLRFDQVVTRFAGQPVHVIGHRAGEIARTIGPEATAETASPSAQAIALAAAERLGQTIVPPRPLYVRPADAAPPREAPPTLLP